MKPFTVPRWFIAATVELSVLSEHKRHAMEVALNSPIDMKLASR